MSAEVLPLPLLPDLASFWESELMQQFSLTAERWAGCVSRMSAWEDSNLLDTADVKRLEEHRLGVMWMLRLGRLLSLSTKDPAFPDRELARRVAATMQALEDKMALWHGNALSEPEREQVLQQVFGES